MANMTLIEAKTVGAGGVASVDFTTIPQTYTDLKFVISARISSANAGMFMKFNNSSSNYTSKRLFGDSAVTADSGPTTSIFLLADGNWSTSNTFNNTDVYIPNYASSNYKSLLTDTIAENNTTSSGLYFTGMFAGLWSDTSAITSVAFTPEGGGTFLQNSTFYLYGISNAAISPNAKATGGMIYQDDTYFYHMFTSTGTLTPSQALSNVDYLVVAGGGGAGYGGGGGAGGLRCTVGATGGAGSLPSAISLSSGQAYTITIGSGGTGTQSYANGTQGTTSSIVGGAISISTVGGGAGGGTAPTSGGSGGGYGNNDTGSGSAGTANEGYAGGNGSSPRAGGGGGGSGQVGQNGVGIATGFAGNGGNGISTTIGGNATYYAGGGGGAFNGSANQRQGQGGLGGGGTGGTNGSANQKGGTDGLTATGGGGGACNMNAPIAGNGGSGIVIVRYAK